MLTALAVLFLLIIVLIAVAGYSFVIRRDVGATQAEGERCAICRGRFDKAELILRQIGDYKLLYFCRNCVRGLYEEVKDLTIE